MWSRRKTAVSGLQIAGCKIYGGRCILLCIRRFPRDARSMLMNETAFRV